MRMVKLRDARCCNIKLLLIYLVIYGHLIEPLICDSRFLMLQYRCIYLFHMPLFAFLSGSFLKDAKSCGRQSIRLLFLYVLLQTAVVVFGEGSVTEPSWYLWYLLSCGAWCAAGWMWYLFGGGKWRLQILFGAVALGCAVGVLPFVGRAFSASRTIVFFPYFWAGLICGNRRQWERLRLYSVAALLVTVVAMGFWGGQLPTEFLYHAEPYDAPVSGMLLRLLCYFAGGTLCLFVLSFAPSRRYPFTRAGGDTMMAYLAHGILIWVAKRTGVHVSLYSLIAAAYLFVIYQIGQWRGCLYGIVPTERGESLWAGLKLYIRSMQSRSTVFCSPSREARMLRKNCFRKHFSAHCNTSTDLKDGAVCTRGCAGSGKTSGSENAAGTADAVP